MLSRPATEIQRLELEVWCLVFKAIEKNRYGLLKTRIQAPKVLENGFFYVTLMCKVCEYAKKCYGSHK